MAAGAHSASTSNPFVLARVALTTRVVTLVPLKSKAES